MSRSSFPDYLRGFWNALATAELKDSCIVLPEGHACTIESVTCVIKERVCWDFVAYAASRLQQGGVSQSSVLAARSAILRSQLNSSNKHLPDGMPLTHGTSMLSAYVAGRELCREIPDKLLHYVVDHHFCATGVAFASPYVAQEVIKRITMEQFMEVRLLISYYKCVNTSACCEACCLSMWHTQRCNVAVLFHVPTWRATVPSTPRHWKSTRVSS